MTTVNSSGYLCRQKPSKRNWWFVKATDHPRGLVNLGFVCFPKHLVGRKVRFKVEVIE